MSSLHSIVVGYDFSPCADSALVQAARSAERNNATLHVIHVIESLVVADLAEATHMDPDEERAQAMQAATAALESVVEPLRTAGHRIEITVRVGSPVRLVLEFVREVRADLLVLGVFGVSSPNRGAGTLATKCVRKAPTRVLLVDAGHDRPFRRVVACVDFSAIADVAVDHALKIAETDGGRLDLLHVFHGPWHRLHYRSPTPQASPDFQQQYRAALVGRLDTYREHCLAQAKGVDVRTVLREHVSVGQSIVEYAREIGADLIVLGTVGRTALWYIVLGSTAERVLRELQSSVLTIKPKSLAMVAEDDRKLAMPE